MPSTRPLPAVACTEKLLRVRCHAQRSAATEAASASRSRHSNQRPSSTLAIARPKATRAVRPTRAQAAKAPSPCAAKKYGALGMIATHWADDGEALIAVSTLQVRHLDELHKPLPPRTLPPYPDAPTFREVAYFTFHSITPDDTPGRAVTSSLNAVVVTDLNATTLYLSSATVYDDAFSTGFHWSPSL